jgi:hypothetical protein
VQRGARHLLRARFSDNGDKQLGSVGRYAAIRQKRSQMQKTLEFLMLESELLRELPLHDLNLR